MRQRGPAVVFRCDDGEDGCGITFVAQDRHARKIRQGVHRQLCRRCAGLALRKKPHQRPDATDLIFWLERFSDAELALIVWAWFGEDDTEAAIADSRAELLHPSEQHQLVATGT